MGYGTQQPDGVVLDVLDRVLGRGQSYAEAGAPHGMTRSAVGGMMKRVRDDADIAEGLPIPRGFKRAFLPENMDGGMPARWWEAGLAARLPRKGEAA
jgi:hypothetical protein